MPVAGADAVIGNRAYGTEPGKVAAIARAVTEGLEQGGVLPVLKHIPGHGRATADTHFRLPDGRYAARRSWNGPISPHFNRWRTCRWP